MRKKSSLRFWIKLKLLVKEICTLYKKVSLFCFHFVCHYLKWKALKINDNFIKFEEFTIYELRRKKKKYTTTETNQKGNQWKLTVFLTFIKWCDWLLNIYLLLQSAVILSKLRIVNGGFILYNMYILLCKQFF